MVCIFLVFVSLFFFFFKQKTAYEMRISDWSSDVCSSDLEQFYLLWPLVFALAIGTHRTMAVLLIIVLGSVLVTPLTLWAAKPLQNIVPYVPHLAAGRSEERRVGKECVSTCRSRWSPYH